ncbi:methyltransferase-like protein 27 [Dunckerocampus dactyliophorus]|uniref:methyltransferase-like protein 27 n=1 Tax=Dunckerocampus dactyliophorus TaxID=161453 RepID=UPI002406156A|nr:methyltransferase-like protein 27 [Dunckerocampus dactyliophorus]XP_054610448.1 methyltransferase-like protein 27 [Dunckerocampus dactyliophorus]
MSAVESRTLEDIKDLIVSCHKGCTTAEKISFYNNWANSYEQDVAVLDYRAPSLAASAVAAHFCGERQAALVLDVACGTGMVAKLMKKDGFGRFVGVDASEGMLQRAAESGLYQDLKLALLGEEPLPVQLGHFDIVLVVGGLSMGHIQVKAIRELCQAARQGGLICMTTRGNPENLSYKAALEDEIKRMEEEGLWCGVDVTEVKEWERAVNEHEEDYVPGCVYLFKKL